MVEASVPTVLAGLVAEIVKDHTPGDDCFTLEQLRVELHKVGIKVGLSRAKQIVSKRGYQAVQRGRKWYWTKPDYSAVIDE